MFGRRSGYATVALFVATLFVQVAPNVSADRGPEAEQLDGEDGPLSGDEYIVRFVDGADVDAEASRLRRQGVEIVASYDEVFPGVSVNASNSEVSRLRDDPQVASVSRDREIQMLDTTQTNPPWGLDRIDQRNRPLSNSYTYPNDGSGVKVYVIDSGINRTHVDFGGRVMPGTYMSALGDSDDCNGHGTHVAGTIGGSTYGVAKGVTLIPLKVFDCDGVNRASWLLSAIDYAISDHPAGAPAVMNLSLGSDVSSTLDRAVQSAINDGITVVVAAGNDGKDACQVSPARLPAAITVAASDSSDNGASFSNWGTCVDIFAPGVNVKSTWFSSNTATRSLDGTSMATPHVAGAAALILAQTPAMQPTQVAEQLIRQSTPGLIGNTRTSPNRLLFGTPAPVAPAVTPTPPPTPPPAVPVAEPVMPIVPDFVSLVPSRLLETRVGLPTVDGVFAGGGVVPAGGVVELLVGGRGGVPVDASAVVLNVTVTEPVAAGFVTVFPCGSVLPASSSVNVVAGATVANAVISKVGGGGRVCVFSSVATQLIADVNGYFPAGSGFVSLVPSRLLETRVGLSTVDGVFAGGGVVPAGGVVELLVGGRGGVPVDASAVVLNVTVTEPVAAGFVTVFPCGSVLPASSSVNVVAGATVANAVISKVGGGGRVCVFSSVATQLIADVNGYFPAGSGFVSLVPSRLLETRVGLSTVDGVFAGGGVVPAGGVVELLVGGRGGVPVDASAVVLNVTVTEPVAAGFVTVFPCGSVLPASSSVNVVAGATVANAVISKVGGGGRVCVFSSVATQLIADVNGYFPA